MGLGIPYLLINFMSHNHAEDPVIWEVLDLDGKRLTMLVKHTAEEAFEQATAIYGSRLGSVVDTGKRKPPSKCCNTCKDKPCS